MLRTWNQHYVNVDGNGGLVATATNYDDAAVFRIDDLEGEVRARTEDVTIQSSSTGKYLSGGSSLKALDDSPLRFEGTFLWTEYDSGKAKITVYTGKNVKLKSDGSQNLWIASGGGSYAYFDVIRGLPGFDDNEVMLRDYDGNYLKVAADGTINATADGYEDAAVFKVNAKPPEVIAEHQVAIRSRLYSNSYVKADGGGSADTSFTGSIGDWETFTMFEHEDGTVQFRAHDGTYLSRDGADVDVTAQTAGINETFRKLPGTLSSPAGAETVMLQNYDGSGCLWSDLSFSEVIPLTADGECANSSNATITHLNNLDIVYLDWFPVSHLVNIRSVYNNKYVHAPSGSGQLQITQNSPDQSGTFLLTEYADRSVTVKTHHNTFAGNSGVGDRKIIANTTRADRQIATMTMYNTNTLRFKAQNGSYWNVASDNSLKAEWSTLSSKGEFEVEYIQTTVTPPDFSTGSDLVIPSANGGSFTLPNADLTYTVSPWGTLDTLSGTADFPLVPMDANALSIFGDVDAGAGARVTVIYDRGDEIQGEASFPLNPSEKYFFLEYAQGADVEWNGISAEAPNSGSFEMAIDHASPALFMYSDLPLFGDLLNSAGFGVSGRNNIPFIPTMTDVPTRDEPEFNGAVYLQADFPIPLASLPEVFSLSMDADTVIDVNLARLGQTTGLPTEAIDRIGANGTLNASFDIGPVHFADAELGNATLVFNNENQSDPWLAFSGEFAPYDKVNLPFGLKLPNSGNNKISLKAYLDATPDDGHPSYVRIDADISSFADLPGVSDVTLKGHFQAGETGLDFAGKANFAGRKITVSGTADDSGVDFTGEYEEGFSGKESIRVCVPYVGCSSIGARWEIEYTITLDLSLGNQTEVGLGVSAKACGGISGSKAINMGDCANANASVEVLSNGHLKVCGRVPGVGTKCATL